MSNIDRFLDSRAKAIFHALEWIDSMDEHQAREASIDGLFDRYIHVSSAEGFSLAALLPSKPSALDMALRCGWRADSPCVRAQLGGGQAGSWLPFEACAYWVAPCKITPDQAARCLALFGAAGVRMSEANPSGETALHCAASASGPDGAREEAANPMLLAILAHETRVDARDLRGRCALHVAQGQGNISALLAAGANPMARDIRGERAIDALMRRPGGPEAYALHELRALDAVAGCGSISKANRI